MGFCITKDVLSSAQASLVYKSCPVKLPHCATIKQYICKYAFKDVQP
ncbi:hypothetical protein Tsp_06161, partial [Trichinella spiralis]